MENILLKKINKKELCQIYSDTQYVVEILYLTEILLKKKKIATKFRNKRAPNECYCHLSLKNWI